jgi:lysine 6-dehydrogenase
VSPKKAAPKAPVATGPTYAVIGGAGAMGRITVRDFVETAGPDATILIADYNLPAAKKLAASFGSPRVRAVQVDVTNVGATARALKGVFAVASCVQHDFNLPVMRACLAAGSHYVDLGGLFHVTRQQLKLHGQFKKKKLLALLGMGAAPGIVNVLARKGADDLDEVHEIHVMVGGVDRTPGRTPSILGASYSMQTIIEEASEPAAFFTGGKFTFVEALSGDDEVHFPAPVGTKKPARTLHSEVATLPLSYKDKGVREVSFRIAFSPELVEKLRFLRALGLLSGEPVKMGKGTFVPRDVLLRLLRDVAPGNPGGAPDEYEVLRVVVRGKKNGVGVERTIDGHTPGIPDWGLGVDADTGCPPSICCQLIWRGDIAERGCLPPEKAVPVAPFLAELAKRRITVREQERLLPGGAPN